MSACVPALRSVRRWSRGDGDWRRPRRLRLWRGLFRCRRRCAGVVGVIGSSLRRRRAVAVVCLGLRGRCCRGRCRVVDVDVGARGV